MNASKDELLDEAEEAHVINARLRGALADLLPLAEQYLWNAPSHPDNAKLETARDLLRQAPSLIAIVS